MSFHQVSHVKPHENVKVAILFEFGVPHYRRFLLQYLNSRVGHLRVICGTDKFAGIREIPPIEAFRLFGRGDVIVYLFNPLLLRTVDVVITTLNPRRPHTWLCVFLLPWKRWIFWGKGVGRSDNALVRVWRKLLFMLSDGFVVYTEGGRRRLVAAGYPKHRISVAYNTLEIPNHSLTVGGQYFIFVGRVQNRKKLGFVLQHLMLLKKRLLVIGEEADSGVFRLEVKRLGCGSLVEWNPAIYDHMELKKKFDGAIAYVSPGHVGLGVVHAFGYGVPVITVEGENHSPEIEYCNVQNSYLCKSEQELGEAMERCITNPLEHARKRKAAYRFYAERLSVENVFAAFEAQLSK